MLVYIDESGNTGKNYLDSGQPFYILGGWLLDSKSARKASRVVVSWETSVKKDPRGGELSSGRFLRREDAFVQLWRLFCALGEAGCIPTHCAFEKRFGACAKIIDVYLDPDHNPAIRESFRVDANAKWEHANLLYGTITDESIAEFFAAYEEATPEALGAFRKKLVLRLTGTEARILADLFWYARDEGASEYARAGTEGINAINTTVFFSQIMMVEGFFRAAGIKRGKLIHDSIPELKTALVTAHKALKGAERARVDLNNDHSIYLGGGRLAALSFTDSAGEPLIRAADYYVGTLNFLLRKRSDVQIRERKGYREILGTLLSPLIDKATGSPELPELYFHTASAKVLGETMAILTAPN